jgi:hypothetical protein
MKLINWLAVVPTVQNGWGFAALVLILLLWHFWHFRARSFGRVQMPECPHCHGERMVHCLTCHGSGKRFVGFNIGDCKECTGTGKHPCAACGGTGVRGPVQSSSTLP